MTKFTLILTILMLSTVLSNSQTMLQTMKASGQDTVCTVSIKTIRTVNHAFADLEACNLLADTINAQKKRIESLAASLQEKIQIDAQLLQKEKDTAVQLEVLVNSYKKTERRNKFKLAVAKFSALTLAAVATIETGFIYLVMLKK